MVKLGRISRCRDFNRPPDFYILSSSPFVRRPSFGQLDGNHKFVFNIKTTSGDIIENIAIEAKDAEAAMRKLAEAVP